MFRLIELKRYHPVKHFNWVLPSIERFIFLPVVVVIDSLFSTVVVSLFSIVVVVIEPLLLIFILDVGRS